MPDNIQPRKARYMTRGYILSGEIAFRDRVKLLLGGRVLVSATIFSEHKPGQTACKGRLFVTKEPEIAGAVKEFEAFEDAEQAAKKQSIDAGVV